MVPARYLKIASVYDLSATNKRKPAGQKDDGSWKTFGGAAKMADYCCSHCDVRDRELCVGRTGDARCPVCKERNDGVPRYRVSMATTSRLDAARDMVDLLKGKARVTEIMPLVRAKCDNLSGLEPGDADALGLSGSKANKTAQIAALPSIHDADIGEPCHVDWYSPDASEKAARNKELKTLFQGLNSVSPNSYAQKQSILREAMQHGHKLHALRHMIARFRLGAGPGTLLVENLVFCLLHIKQKIVLRFIMLLVSELLDPKRELAKDVQAAAIKRAEAAISLGLSKLDRLPFEFTSMTLNSRTSHAKSTAS
jgi:hypothetical protein